MTIDQATETIPVRLDFDAPAADFSRAMAHLDKAATKELNQAGIDPLLRELIRVRASQLNGCAYCVDMHTKDARAAGERAAFTLTESVTQAATTHVPDDDFAQAAALFSEAELAAIISLIVTIN